MPASVDGLTFAELVERFGLQIDNWAEVTPKIAAWASGTVAGGPEGDGRYPLPTGVDEDVLWPCPARIVLDAQVQAADPADLQPYVDAAEDARDVSVGASGQAVAARNDVEHRLAPGLSFPGLEDSFWAVILRDTSGRHAGGWDRTGRFHPLKMFLPIDTVGEDAPSTPLFNRLLPQGVSFAAGEDLDWAMVLRDASGRHAGGWDRSGRFCPIKMLIPATATVSDRPNDHLVDRLVPADVGSALGAADTEAGIAFAVRDAAGHLKFVVPVSGPLWGRIQRAVVAESVVDGGVGLAALGADVRAKLATNRYIAQLTGSTPSRKIAVSDRTAGTRRLITATDPSDARIVDDSVVVYTEAGVEKYQPALGGTAWPVYPNARLTLFGDSLTAASTGVSAVGSVLGITTLNRGVGGQGAADIAMRQGGLTPALTVTGNSIPASGAVTVTAISPSTGYRLATAFSFLGKLAGVPGTLARSSAEVWTFTRTTAGSAVACPAGSLFVSDEAAPSELDVQSIWMGRNNVGTATFSADVIQNVARCVAFMKPLVSRFVIIGVTNGTNEGIGTANYIAIQAVNAALASTYGGRFYDLRADFIANGLATAGLTPTADDLADIAADRPPRQLMADSIHPTTTGYAAQKTLFAAWLTQKGYFL